MDCGCLFHKICGYYNKGVYVQLLISTTRQYFFGLQHAPEWNVHTRKPNLQKTLEITEINEDIS